MTANSVDTSAAAAAGPPPDTKHAAYRFLQFRIDPVAGLIMQADGTLGGVQVYWISPCGGCRGENPPTNGVPAHVPVAAGQTIVVGAEILNQSADR